MAITVVDSGTKLADGTEQTLVSTTNSGHYTATIDKSLMQAGDTLEIRYYKKVLAGSALLPIDKLTFIDAQPADDKLCFVPPVTCPFGYKITLKQTAGTNRNYEWSVETP